MSSSTSQLNVSFAITRIRVLVVLFLAITWLIASILHDYTPTIKQHVKTRLGEARQKIPKVKIDWHVAPDSDPRDRYNASKVALLIEPRPVPHLVPQILHMISVVPPDWRFLFVGSNRSVVSVARSYATRHQQAVGKLDLMVLPDPWEIDSKESVHRLLTDVRFYDEFLPGVEWILKYEYDSILCANSGTSLNEWLHWDWAGAPRTADDHFSGNGGLSIRRVSAIKRVLKFQERYNDTAPEDEWFGTRVWVLPGANVASGETGQLAVEDTYIPNAMGFHVRDGGQGLAGAMMWRDRERRREVFEYCPELSLIMDMKLEVERCDGDNGDGTMTIPEVAAAAAGVSSEEQPPS
ncbi:Uu.00g081530.m01.CDS01 [Anthostomella pinea]|uniref:Uu.00g081530.m01.CDS01 n=1 Tax=Anthostomella pinea TaxID=933095 RepID=A0AAI8VLU3_9PEZI|nr:Uu.00g081530.m01.CDS01 [Anthostomella pinea]